MSSADERVELGELVILGAREKAARLRAERVDVTKRRRELAERIRQGDVPVDRTPPTRSAAPAGPVRDDAADGQLGVGAARGGAAVDAPRRSPR